LHVIKRNCIFATINIKNNKTMKTNRLFYALIALLLMLPVFSMTSCSEEDAPTYTHSVADLNGTWLWETTESEDFSEFYVYISQGSASDEIIISNFGGQSKEETITAKVSGTTFTFAGVLNGGEMEIKNGIGTIMGGYQSISISFEYNVGEGDQVCKANLSSQKELSKKALVGVSAK